MHRQRTWVLWATLLGAATSAAAQDSSGPPSGGARARGSSGVQSTTGGAGPRTSPENDDIQVNQISTGVQNEPTIAVNPLDPDHWVCAANDYSSGSVLVGWYTTLDAGETWTTGLFDLPSGSIFSGDPCACFHEDGGVTVVFMSLGGQGNLVTSVTSNDGGLTWGPLVELDADSDNNRPQIDVDRSQGPFRGDLTVTWERLFGGGVFVTTSQDGGATWSASVRVDDPADAGSLFGPDVSYGKDSRLFVTWANISLQEVRTDVSLDGGQTWSTDRLVSAYSSVPSPIPGSHFRVFDIFSAAADWTEGPHGGTLYVTWHTWDPAGHADVMCAASADDGLTWIQDLVHDGDLGVVDQFFPAVDTDVHGNAHVVFYDRRRRADNELILTWIARSSDGGAVWTDRKVSDEPWDHKQSDFSSFIGDYIDVAAGARNVVPVWCDEENGSQEIYTDPLRLDLYTKKDTLSASNGGAVDFFINIGPNHAGSTYLLLGSFSGTEPGLDFGGGVHLPLNWDLLTTLTLTLANTAVFKDFRGVLDATGSAEATIDSLGPFDPAAVGLDLDFAVLLIDGDVTFGSNPTRLTVVQ